MANAAVVECYATLVEGFNTLRSNGTRHRGADYRRGAGQVIVAYETCTVTNSDFYSSALGHCLTATRARDGKSIGWAHIRKGTRPANGTVLQPGDQVGIVAGWGEDPGSAWSGPHIHTTEDDGNDWTHIYQGQNSDPVPDITAAKAGTAGGGGTPVVNYHWWDLSAEAMGACQRMLNRIKLYGGTDGGTGPEDNDFGERSVKGMQEFFKRRGYLPGDYEVDGVPHNADQNAPSNYGFAMQKFAHESGYDGLDDGLPGPYTSQFVVQSANKVGGTPPPPPPPPPPPAAIPVFPPVPEGFVFMPDLATTQSAFDFAEYRSKGGAWTALKMGGGNTSDAPYVAPAYRDQLDRARAQSLRIVAYWFNGRKNGLTPESSADYFATHADFKPGMVVAIDVENETATGTTHWTPAEAVAFAKRLRVHFPGINGLAYMSDSVADAEEWDELVALGWQLWNASWGDNDGDPNVAPTTDDWPFHLVWQYTSNEKVPGNYIMQDGTKVYQRTDGNIARGDLFDLLGWAVPPPPPPPPDEIDLVKLTAAIDKIAAGVIDAREAMVTIPPDVAPFPEFVKNFHLTTDSSPRPLPLTEIPKVMLVLHHAGGRNGVPETIETALELFDAGPPREVSCTICIDSDGTCWGIVPWQLRPWTTGHPVDNIAITLECINSELVGDPTKAESWLISDETYASIALVAKWMDDEFSGFSIDDDHINTHRDYNPSTICPGALSVEKVIELARL